VAYRAPLFTRCEAVAGAARRLLMMLVEVQAMGIAWWCESVWWCHLAADATDAGEGAGPVRSVESPRPMPRHQPTDTPLTVARRRMSLAARRCDPTAASREAAGGVAARSSRDGRTVPRIRTSGSSGG
jgi:hypothetical protein